MSWQTIVDSLMSSKHMAHAGIFGHDGNSWATTKNFPINAEGVKTIAAGIADSNKIANGLSLNKEHYILIRSDPGTMIILKKGENSIVGYKTAKSILIGTNEKNIKAEQVLTDVGKVADYLTKTGY